VRGAERGVAIAFSLAALASLGLCVVYLGGGQPQAEGALLFLALGGIGAGLMLWAKRLMSDIGEETQQRELRPPRRTERQTSAEAMLEGVEEIRRRRFLSRLLLGAGAALGIAALFPIRSLGRAPRGSLFTTPWRAGTKLVNTEGELITRDTLEVGSFTTVFPEGDVGSADGQAVLIRLEPGQLRLPADRLEDAPEGIVAYSKICTHVGCPVSLYEQQTHHVLCPCHQSTFDLSDGARVIFGPAGHALPQLKISVNNDGFLEAQGDFEEPVGPAFWERRA
jgi:ubiquinol-cytochrome c reductase iron-sulfur subunit